MSAFELFRQPLPAWADWILLALMSIAAPVVAGCIHSLCVLNRGIRLYNAEIGGGYFYGSALRGQSVTVAFLYFIGVCGLPAVPTFLALLPFRHKPELSRVVWIGIVASWTWFCFSTEIGKGSVPAIVESG
ncbi:MAG: hypothetical protein U1F98_00345 [Verrucomicrobiota bacterium]